MTSLVVAPVGTTGPWPRHVGVLAGVVAMILALFAHDVAQVAGIWWISTTYGHCLFIGPVVAWLVWTRRVELAALTPVAWWPGLLLVAAGGFGWLLGDAGSLSIARQLGLVLILQGVVVTLLGPNVARGLLFPFCYALFLVPFGDFLEPPLQEVTVAIVMPLLHLVGITASVDGVLIHAGRYYFEVAEACSGAKFVIAMLAFGILVAATCFRSWRRRAGFMLVALVVPVLANGVRAWGTIYAADLWGIERATGLDHIVYGWLFFGLVMAGVLALGWRWFDSAPDAPAFDAARLQAPPRYAAPLVVAAALTLATGAFFLAWSAAIAGRAASLPHGIDLPQVAGWTRSPLGRSVPWQPHHPGADRHLFGRYTNGRNRVDVGIAIYATQHEGKELVAFGTGVLAQEDRWVRVADLSSVAGGSAMRIVAPGPVERTVATWYRVGPVVTADEKRVKLETMRARLTGADQMAVALHIAVPGDDPAAIARFVAAAGGPAALLDRAIR